MQYRILIAEDEERIREIVGDYFRSEGCTVLEARNGREALDIIEIESIDLLILDIMMPEMDGWSVCRRLRRHSSVPIILLTARADEDDKLMGYELGADEYVTKPFSPRVLVAQAKSLLKRAEGMSPGRESAVLTAGGIELNRDSHLVKCDYQSIELAPKEYELLLYLMSNQGRVLSREHILDKVWGYDYYGDIRAVDTHVKKLRQKLGEKAVMIQTVVRSGYKFEVLP